MLLSRSWGYNIGGSIKLDLTYDTIPLFGGEERWLYRESRFVKTVKTIDCSNNAHVYGKEKEFHLLLLEENELILEETQVESLV